MDWQFIVAALLVIGCAVYALRSLLPSAWRFGKRGAARASIGACGGCTGCSAGTAGGAKPAAATGTTESVIRIVSRRSMPGSAADPKPGSAR